MAIVPLAGRVRPETGKGPARSARRAGEIPGVIYGAGETPVALAIPKKEFELALKTAHAGGNVIVALRLDGAAEKTAIIREVQRDPISHDILHLDFHHISLTEKVTVEVTVHLVGIPDGVKNGGGILEHITRTIEIVCLPRRSAAPRGRRLGARDRRLDPRAGPERAERRSPVGSTTIATVVPPTVMTETVAAPAAGTTTEPEVIAKGKVDEAGAKGKDEK
jgi:large subunit ribosomal protein L25